MPLNEKPYCLGAKVFKRLWNASTTLVCCAPDSFSTSLHRDLLQMIFSSLMTSFVAELNTICRLLHMFYESILWPFHRRVNQHPCRECNPGILIHCSLDITLYLEADVKRVLYQNSPISQYKTHYKLNLGAMVLTAL
jgi:hypothetical protein